jgi:hypothetical protein
MYQGRLKHRILKGQNDLPNSALTSELQSLESPNGRSTYRV